MVEKISSLVTVIIHKDINSLVEAEGELGIAIRKCRLYFPKDIYVETGKIVIDLQDVASRINNGLSEDDEIKLNNIAASYN